MPCAIHQENLFIATEKKKEGQIDRLVDSFSFIEKGTFSSMSHVESFVGLRVLVDGLGQEGVIERPFGKSGKFLVTFRNELAIGKEDKIVGRPLTLVYDVNTLDPLKMWDVIGRNFGKIGRELGQGIS